MQKHIPCMVNPPFNTLLQYIMFRMTPTSPSNTKGAMLQAITFHKPSFNRFTYDYSVYGM